MRIKKKGHSRMRMTWSAIFMFMLLFYTALPYTGARAAILNASLSVNTSNLTEQSITSGNSASIQLTLSGDVTWAVNSDDKKKALIDALVASDQSDQWEKVKNALKNNLGSCVTVTGDTVTIQIPKVSDNNPAKISDADYYLTKDQKISLDVPYQVLSDDVNLGKQPITITATPKVLISGTATPTVSQSDIAKGGKTVVVTLVNATWDPEIASNTTKREALLSGFQWSSSDQITMQNLLNARAKVVRTNNQVVTITLPPIEGYSSYDDVTFEPSVINNSLYITPNIGNPDAFSTTPVPAFTDKPISIGQIATADLTPWVMESSIQNGTAISITLNGATWDSELATNKSKLSALLKGFTAEDQTNAWSLVSSKIQSAVISPDKQTLTLIVPPIPNYSIIKSQTVDVKISKSLLVDYKSDISAGQLYIMVPYVNADKTLSDLLSDDFANYIDENGINNIRVIVPEKKVHTIYSNTVEVPGVGTENKSITTLEVSTTPDVSKVIVTIKGQNGEVTKEKDGNGKFTFVFTNIEKNSDITVSVYNNSNPDPLQNDIHMKFASGSKTISEEPKTSLDGSYSLYSLLSDKSLLSNIFKYYSADELKVGVTLR